MIKALGAIFNKFQLGLEWRKNFYRYHIFIYVKVEAAPDLRYIRLVFNDRLLCTA